MDLTIGRKRKYKLPIIIGASTALVMVTIATSILVYGYFYMGRGPVAGCEKKVINTDDVVSSQKYFICERDMFTVQVHEDIAYELPQTYIDDLMYWFKTEVPYGPEVLTFKTLRLSATGSGSAYADYVPSDSAINIYYNAWTNGMLTSAKSFYGDSSIDRYDLRLWKYTIAHEYGHHMTVRNMTDNRMYSYKYADDIANGLDRPFVDIRLSENGNKFFETNGYAQKGHFQDPMSIIGSANERYLWTKAELMTRELQTYAHNGRETQKWNNDNLTDILYYSGSRQDYTWRKGIGLLGYETSGTIYPKSLTSTQKNIEAIKKHLYGATDTPLHAVYYDQSVGFVLNTASTEYRLVNKANGRVATPSYNREMSNYWYNQTFLDGNSRVDFDTERYAMVYNDSELPAGTYTLDLNGDQPTNSAMGLDENKSQTIYHQANSSLPLVTISRGNGNNYTIQIH